MKTKRVKMKMMEATKKTRRSLKKTFKTELKLLEIRVENRKRRTENQKAVGLASMLDAAEHGVEPKPLKPLLKEKKAPADNYPLGAPNHCFL